MPNCLAIKESAGPFWQLEARQLSCLKRPAKAPRRRRRGQWSAWRAHLPRHPWPRSFLATPWVYCCRVHAAHAQRPIRNQHVWRARPGAPGCFLGADRPRQMHRSSTYTMPRTDKNALFIPPMKAHKPTRCQRRSVQRYQKLGTATTKTATETVIMKVIIGHLNFVLRPYLIQGCHKWFSIPSVWYCWG